jgi:hypothetical protein
MKTLTVECPDRLVAQLDEYVKDGWAAGVGEAVVEALRRFLESHRPDIARAQMLSDVEWGLHGKD